MKYDRKLLYLFAFSIGLLIFSFLLFIYIFCFAQKNALLYLICLALFIVCAVSYYILSKKMMCEDGYTWVQAYLFYNSCKRKGVHTEPKKLTPSDIALIRKLANNYEFSKNFNSKEARKLFETGYEISKII